MYLGFIILKTEFIISVVICFNKRKDFVYDKYKNRVGSKISISRISRMKMQHKYWAEFNHRFSYTVNIISIV